MLQLRCGWRGLTWVMMVFPVGLIGGIVAAEEARDETVVLPNNLPDWCKPPVRLRSADGVIDVGAALGHAGPCLADADGDGVRDLVVGSFDGKFRLFRNVGTNEQPEYASFSYIQAGGEDAKVWIYCCIGSSPQFHDLDGDGIADLLSGSYDPGELYWFKGAGSGRYEARQAIVDRNGRPILHHPHQQQDYESFGSWVSMVDWESDGDLDIVLGAFDGAIMVRINEGTATKPLFATDNLPLLVDGEPAMVPGKHAAIDVADWDGDGLWDVVSGSDAGGAWWFRNVGTPEAPDFTGPHELLPVVEQANEVHYLEPGTAAGPGMRTQVDAVDYNGDGKMDLLVGDFCGSMTLRPDLTAEQRKEFDAMREERAGAVAVSLKLLEDLRDWHRRTYPEDSVSAEADAGWTKAYNEMKERSEWKTSRSRYEELSEALHEYLVPPEKEGRLEKYTTQHGRVWLYVRK